MTEGATEISNRTASEAETVAAAAEEQTANLSDVSDSADRLSDRASDLWTALEAFEVDDAAETDAGDDGDADGGDGEAVAVAGSADGGTAADSDGDDAFEWSEED